MMLPLGCFINYSIIEGISSMIKTNKAWLINYMNMLK